MLELCKCIDWNDERRTEGRCCSAFWYELGCSMILLKVLTPDDWGLWRQLRLAALQEASEAFGSTLADWRGDGDREERWRHRLAAVSFNVIASVNEDLAGMVSGDCNNHGAELISLWVAPFARGQGVGDRLVEAVVQWACHQYVTRLCLSVRDHNAPAIRLYRRQGFRSVGPSPESDPGSPETLFVRYL